MPCGFSLEHYKEMLSEIARGYEAMRFRDWRAAGGKSRVFMRHDVDHSLRVAVEMARVEAEAGVPATYFVLLHADLYSAATPRGAALIRELVSLGHEVGLHYDTDYYAVAGGDARAGLAADLDALGNIVGSPVVSVCKHNPLDSLPVGALEGMARFNAYSDPFMKDVKYISDSNMAWREGCACGFLARGVELQMLTHPLWWVAEGAGLRERIIACGRIEAEHYRCGVEASADYLKRSLAQRAELDLRFKERGI
jgi:hypothetical protein